MQFLCINLPGSRLRRESMEAQLQALNIAVEWVPGVTASEIPEAELQGMCDMGFQRNVNDRLFMPGEIGCSLAHLNAYRFMLSRNLAWAVILEDDVVLDANLVAAVDAAALLLDDTRPEVLLLNQARRVFADTRQAVLPGYSIAEVSSARLAWGYLLNAAAAQAILAGNCPVRFLADDWKRIRYYCNCRISAVIPPLVGERVDLVSDIRGPDFRKLRRRPSLGSRLRRLPLKLSRLLQKANRRVVRTTEAERTLSNPVDIPRQQ
ncbi:MAG: glycosyltransferase family 25 protein [Pseudomonadota bacterium]